MPAASALPLRHTAALTARPDPASPLTAGESGLDEARLIALDWGTTSLRAYLMDATGHVLAERASGHGIRHLPAAGHVGFELALQDLTADWQAHQPALPLVACGMVGSVHGWREAPYVPCPATWTELAHHAVAVPRPGLVDVLIAPGVCLSGPDAELMMPDVMRGEETQIAGALAAHPAWTDRAEGLCVVLPGTHSKWATVRGGALLHFSTWMTGELFAVLRAHSILGQLMHTVDDASAIDTSAADEGFRRGVADAARSGGRGLTHQLFATRTLALMRQLPPEALADYLSGLLIGHEILGAHSPDAALVLIGAPDLCQRYERALTQLDRPLLARLDNTAPAGLHRLALAAGLLGPGSSSRATGAATQPMRTPL